MKQETSGEYLVKLIEILSRKIWHIKIKILPL
jgi:hypothetical protein